MTNQRPEALRAWREIEGWARAASVRRTLRHSRFGFLGNTYSGMLDMYSDFTMIQAQTGLHVEVLEMSDLARLVRDVTPHDVSVKREELHTMFEISGDSPSSSTSLPIATVHRPQARFWRSGPPRLTGCTPTSRVDC